MGVILGVIFHFIGGFASGSFYMPFKKVKDWSWESYWIIGGLFSWLIVPPLAAWLTLPGFSEIISENPGRVNHAARGGTMSQENKPPIIQ